MVNTIQADYQQLQQIAKVFDSEADKAKRLRNMLRGKVDGLRGNGFVGQGAEAFYREMDQDLFPALERLEQALMSASDTVQFIIKAMQSAEEEASSHLKFDGDGGGLIQQAINTVRQAQEAVVQAAQQIFGKPAQRYVDGERYVLINGQYVPFTPEMAEGKEIVLFQAGIMTGDEGFEEGLARIQKQYEGQNVLVIGIRNQTDGLINDTLQALSDRVQGEGFARGDVNNPAITTMHNTLLEQLQNGRPVTIEAHSQGGAIASVSLQLLYEDYKAGRITAEQFANIHVKTYGSFGTDYPPGPRYDHYINPADLVPLSANFLNVLDNPLDLADQMRYFKNVHITLDPMSLHPLTNAYNMLTMQAHGHERYLSLPATPDVEQIVETTMNVGANVVDTARNLWERIF